MLKVAVASLGVMSLRFTTMYAPIGLDQDQTIPFLRRRMIKDMTMRKFPPKTQHDYVRRIKNFGYWGIVLQKSPTESVELEF